MKFFIIWKLIKKYLDYQDSDYFFNKIFNLHFKRLSEIIKWCKILEIKKRLEDTRNELLYDLKFEK